MDICCFVWHQGLDFPLGTCSPFSLPFALKLLSSVLAPGVWGQGGAGLGMKGAEQKDTGVYPGDIIRIPQSVRG